MNHPAPARFSDPDACVEATLSRVGKHVVLGLPVGIGKPNPLVNAFVKRAAQDASIDLTIVTALSLRAPRARSDLERRYLEPFVERVFAGYPELEYVRMIEQKRLPKNIRIIEFFLEPGAWLNEPHFQQQYLSANYTHVARDALQRGLNVIAQIVAPPVGEVPPALLSLGSNPDLTADLLPEIAEMRASGRPFALIGQLHRDLPFMYGDALVPANTFDFLLEEDAAPFSLFSPPNLPIPLTEHAIAMNVSALIRDGGTLQLGIGELGDGIVYALLLRHRQPAIYREIIESTQLLARHRRLIESEGGTASFERGLYGCTEMLVDGFLDLYRSGILKRKVYPCARLQRLLDSGHIDEQVGLRTLEAMSATGMHRMSFVDFHELRDVGVFKDEVEYDKGMLIAPDGRQIPANFQDPEVRAQIAASCLGDKLRNGVLVDAGFFFGPAAFYAHLRELPPEERRLFAMRSISFVNELHGHEWELKVSQRRHARFVNTTMMMTGLGAAVSDGLADGRVVSGVGGQYNFVAMAHALPEARSILCVRATRTSEGVTRSNIVWSYDHTTIPRHLRDIVVTEYGIADLRGKTDREVVESLVSVMDARFHDDFVRSAKRAGKLPSDYIVPDAARANRPEVLNQRFDSWRKQGLFSELPFGSDFTSEELVLGKALKRLQAETRSWQGRMALARRALSARPSARTRPYLERMALDQPASLKERIEQRLLLVTLEEVLATSEERQRKPAP
jgi:acyl-CoA hydrolase